MNDTVPTDKPQPNVVSKNSQAEQPPAPPQLWELTLTSEEIDRLIAEPGRMPLSAFRKMIGRR